MSPKPEPYEPIPGDALSRFGGITTFEELKMIRGLRGVSPPFDPSGNTALVAVTTLFEILCLLAESVDRKRG